MPDAARDAARAVCAFLWRPEDMIPGALPLLMHSAGPMIVRAAFGPPRQTGDGDIIDFGYLAEAAIHSTFGHIPDLRDLIRAWQDEPVRHQ